MPVNKDKTIKGKEKWYYVINDKRINESGRLKKRGFAKQSDAEDEMVEIMDQLNKGNYVKATTITLEEYFLEFIESKKGRVTDETIELYEDQMEIICKSIGFYTLTEITTEIIEDLYKEWTKDGYAVGTILNMHSLLSGCLNRARIRKKIRENPITFIENKPKRETKVLIVWTKDQCIEFLNVVRKSRYHIAFLLAMTTGLRRGEILGLRWSDIDWENQTFHIRQIVSTNGKKILPRTKTKKSTRIIPFPPELVPILLALKDRLEIEKLKNINRYVETDLIICTKYGNHTRPRNLVQYFRNFKDKLTLPDIPFHRLRHVYSSMMGNIGTMPKETAEFLGHSNINMTMHYTHVYDEKMKKSADKFGKFFFGENNEET